jgi:signal transduction histidine kinase
MRPSALKHFSVVFLVFLLAAFLAFGILLRGWAAASSATAMRHELSSLMNQIDRFANDLELELAFMEESLSPSAKEFQELDGKAFGLRWSGFVAQTRFPDLVKSVYVLRLGDRGLYRFDRESSSFIQHGRDDPLAAILGDDLPGPKGDLMKRAQDLQEILAESKDAYSYRVAGVSAAPAEYSPQARQRRVDNGLGFVIFVLDDHVLAGRVLPGLGSLYFSPSTGYTDFAVRVRKADSRIPPIPMGDGTSPPSLDWSETDFSRRLGFSRSILDVSGFYATTLRDAPPPESPLADPSAHDMRTFFPIDAFRFVLKSKGGEWVIEAKHRSGSLEKAISFRTARESLLAFLFLAATYALVTGLILSSRRANALAEREREFIASVSHELKTPIAVVLSAAENMEKGIIAQERVAPYGTMLAREGRRLRDSVESIMLISGLQSAQRIRRNETFALPDAVQSAIAKLDDMAAAKSVRIKLEIERTSVVKASRAMVETAISSLLSNAVRYGPEGGEVLVRLRAAGGRGRRRAEVWVEDRGPGLTAAERRKVFEAFWRGSAAEASRQAGTGLGLHLARRIARIHSGDVAYKPRPGGGACFILSLPEEIEA